MTAACPRIFDAIQHQLRLAETCLHLFGRRCNDQNDKMETYCGKRLEFSIRIDPLETHHPLGDRRVCHTEEVRCNILRKRLRFRFSRRTV